MFVQSSKTLLVEVEPGPEAVTMRKKMNTHDEKQARRMRADREELAERIAQVLPRDGKVEAQPGLVLTRLSSPTGPECGLGG